MLNNTARIFLIGGAAVLISADLCAATVTFYEYDNNSWTTAPSLGSNADKAWKNYNWGQNMNATAAAGPTSGSGTGAQPAAYSIWKVTAPEGQLLTSVTVHTRANFEKNTGLAYTDLAYVEFSGSGEGDWTRLYAHDFNKDPWTQDDQEGLITLAQPASEIYVRIAATKYTDTYYWVGDYVKNGVVVGRQSSLRFTELKVTGETVAAPVPEASSLGLLALAGLMAARKKR